MRTEQEILENDGEVFNLIGKKYKQDVLDNDKDVVIYFYAPWCEKCKNFYPKYERLARKLRNKNKKLLFAKMDATENDIEYFTVNK
jgi:thiol-disulfide isomerase/thioredoxin